MRFITILAIILIALYILSPYDLLPDFFPVTGWLDDAFLFGVLIYYLKFRRLPRFLAWLMRGGAETGSGDAHGHFRANKKGPHFDSSDPYQVLGLKPGAGPEEIRAAYRRAAQAYHPDKVAHLGPELRELAQRKFVDIQKAYDALTRKPR